MSEQGVPVYQHEIKLNDTSIYVLSTDRPREYYYGTWQETGEPVGYLIKDKEQ
jgi:hypothetical protein